MDAFLIQKGTFICLHRNNELYSNKLEDLAISAIRT